MENHLTLVHVVDQVYEKLPKAPEANPAMPPSPKVM